MTLAPPRTAARPGPGPMPEELLRTLELTLRGRIDGLLAGEHRSTTLGPGTELAQIRPYVPGDDVRLIDWNVTARTGEPHVRVQVAERALTTWLVLDTSLSMTFGTGDRRKADVAEGVAHAVGYAATRNGNRLGVVTFGDPSPADAPSAPGQARPARAPARRPARAGRGADRRDVLRGTRSPAWRGSRAAVRWSSSSRTSAGRSTGGASSSMSPAAATFSPSRCSTGASRSFPTSETSGSSTPRPAGSCAPIRRAGRLRERFAERAAAEREELAGLLRSTGADHLVLTTSGDWLRELASFLRRPGPRGAA